MKKLQSFEEAGYVVKEDGTILNPKGLVRKPSFAGKNVKYYVVSWRDKQSKKTIIDLVHRLVAKKYIPNPHGLPEVHHKDFNPLNCHKDNLEWTDGKTNCEHSYSRVEAALARSATLVSPDGLSMMCLMFVSSVVNMTSIHLVYLRCLVANVSHIKDGLFT